ncbi:MAG: response regulator [Planctomycetota bacterium]
MDNPTKTVLVLDDDEVVRESLVFFFEDCGWTPLCAETAEEALEILSTTRTDGAIVDIRLPGMDGNGFIRKAKALHPTLACIICTGSPEYDIPEDLQRLPGVSQQVFAKPVRGLKKLEEELVRLLALNLGEEETHA